MDVSSRENGKQEFNMSWKAYITNRNFAATFLATVLSVFLYLRFFAPASPPVADISPEYTKAVAGQLEVRALWADHYDDILRIAYEGTNGSEADELIVRGICAIVVADMKLDAWRLDQK